MFRHGRHGRLTGQVRSQSCCTPLSMHVHSLTRKVGVLCREYITAKGRRWEEREAFRVQSRRRRPSRPVSYPPEMSDLPSFADWLKARVLEADDGSAGLEEDVL
jgi:hypothetical protein